MTRGEDKQRVCFGLVEWLGLFVATLALVITIMTSAVVVTWNVSKSQAAIETKFTQQITALQVEVETLKIEVTGIRKRLEKD